jgi:hypothetical protein
MPSCFAHERLMGVLMRSNAKVTGARFVGDPVEPFGAI